MKNPSDADADLSPDQNVLVPATIATAIQLNYLIVRGNFTTFPFSKLIVGKLDSWAFWRYIQFQDQSWGL